MVFEKNFAFGTALPVYSLMRTSLLTQVQSWFLKPKMLLSKSKNRSKKERKRRKEEEKEEKEKYQ